MGLKDRLLSCDVAQDKLADSIFYTEEKEKGSGVYLLRRTKDAIHLTLKSAAPEEKGKLYASGAYAGLTFRNDFDPGEDRWCIEVGVPKQQIEEIANGLKANEGNALDIYLALQSFSYEVDDALREWDSPRDLLIHESSTPTALLTVRLLRREPESDAAPEPTEDDEETEPEAYAPIPAPQMPSLDYSAIFKGIRAALWVIAGLMLLHLFK